MTNMPVVTSQYWNIVHGCDLNEAEQDGEGMQTMRTLGKNMAAMVLRLDAKTWPVRQEERIGTNFVR